METKLTEQQSLEVINEMITRARDNVQKGSANSLIYNGYAVATVAVANFVLLHLLPENQINNTFLVWWLMVPSAIIDHFLKKKIDRSAMVKTQIDGIISYIWKGFGISIAVLLAILFFMAYLDTWNWRYFAAINSTIMVMVAMAQFGMAKACRFKPFFRGAVFFWIGAVLSTVCTYVVGDGSLQFLVLAVCMVTGFVIPGHQLNQLAKKNV